ncbi:hypothetical protein RDWZM_006505 [Blomia tropicalis]|uniref:Protein kinase domain-containing protein n=1 Tax=Blomia tropicalis TaxID=40697 RepID=A0A9Q0M8L7_BLOTA|nr:hypothetical protein RDWZM_006505 [Blomia tropicalis]
MRFFDIKRVLVNIKFEVTEMELCGSGSFGRVFSCFAIENGVKTSEKFAVKVIRAESLSTYTLKKWKNRSMREMFYLQSPTKLKKIVGRKINHALRGKYPPGSFLNHSHTEEEAGTSKEPETPNEMCNFEFQTERVMRKLKVVDLVVCGSGAFGTVYSCVGIKNGVKQEDKKLAIKVVRARSLATSTLKKWKRQSKREMYYLHQMKHDNIVKLHDFVWVYNPLKNDEPAYLAMKFEFLETDLERMGKKMGSFSVEILISIAKQIGSAIAYMHSKKIINNDIKPANIMVEKLENGKIGPNSVYKLIDFGLACHTSYSAEKKVPCTMFMGGTMIFMCPEKIGNKSVRKYDPYLSDSYSFGAMLFSLYLGFDEYISLIADADPGQLFLRYLKAWWSRRDQVLTDPHFLYFMGKLLANECQRSFVQDILDTLDNPKYSKIENYFFKPKNGLPKLIE